MTPKEEARYLIEKYNLIVLDTALGGSNTRVKKCALIAVDILIKATTPLTSTHYWKEVKQEIQKL